MPARFQGVPVGLGRIEQRDEDRSASGAIRQDLVQPAANREGHAAAAGKRDQDEIALGGLPRGFLGDGRKIQQLGPPEEIGSPPHPCARTDQTIRELFRAQTGGAIIVEDEDLGALRLSLIATRKNRKGGAHGGRKLSHRLARNYWARSHIVAPHPP